MNKIIIKLSQKYLLIKIFFIFSEMCTIRPYKTDWKNKIEIKLSSPKKLNKEEINNGYAGNLAYRDSRSKEKEFVS